MIDVDSIRRNFNIGPYDATLGAHIPFGTSSGAPLMDNHRALVHWNHTMSQTPPATRPPADSPKSDEDEDDDDEDRPFTPPPPRERLSYTKYQLELLNAIYKEVRYPNSTQKQLIAKRVGITREQVKIWFQNRRRKDVIVKSTKSKSCETSPGSTCSSDSKDSEQRNSPSPDSAENSSSEETCQTNDSEESVVPDVVMKSVINELLKFVNDPLKGKRKKKRSKAKKDKEKANIKKGLAQTLLSGGYDMISPPNQITPTAFFDKAKRGFNHAIGSSAFANPRDSHKPAQISSVSSTSDTSSSNSSKSSETVNSNSRHGNHVPFNQFPFQLPRQPGPMFGNAHTSSLPPLGTGSGCEIPVLSDLLSYKSTLDARHKEIIGAANPHYPNILPSPQHHQISRPDFDKTFPHGINSFPHSRPLNGIFPFPFMAEHPVLLSSLRQPDQLLRPAPQYPTSSIGEDPYQPLLVASLSNPYFSPPSTSWSGQTLQNTATYTQL